MHCAEGVRGMDVKERLAKLIDVKTLVTFTLTGAFTVLSIKGDVKPEIFVTIYTTIIGFYFGTQHEKKNKEE